MKKISLIIFALLLLFAFASDAVIIMRTRSGAETCTNPRQSESGSGSNKPVGSETARLYIASEFQYSGTDAKQICKIYLWLSKIGSPTRNYTAVIYGDNGDEPDETAVIGTSDAFASSDVPAAETKYEINFTTPTSALSNGTQYWVGLYTASADVSNYLLAHIAAACTTERIYYSEDGDPWVYENASYCVEFELVSE